MSSPASSAPAPLTFAFADAPAAPVISADHPDLAGNLFGFEGGSVVREGGVYHLFTAEMAGEPFWAKMRIAHWSSPDALHWRRVSTLYETSGAMRRDDPRFSLWGPMPIFNAAEDRWNLFYVAYRPGVTADEGLHMDGRIWRAVSQTPGRAGIGGPYRDVGIVLQPDAHSQPWEGQQGTDSFYPWPVGAKWYAFYGSHNHVPRSPWLVGLAEAPALAGPWTRCAGLNPSPIEPAFIENPIVTPAAGHYVAIYDNCAPHPSGDYVADGRHVGYSVSADGIHWPQGRDLAVQPEGAANWSDDVRTPLCLVHAEGDRYTMLYTAKLRDRQFWAVGLAHVRCSIAAPHP